MVKSKAAIAGHPIHPMLVSLPIGLFTGAVVADLCYILYRPEWMWTNISFYATIAGVATGLLAAAFGMVDFFAIARGLARRIGLVHMILNVLMLAMFAASAILMLHMDKLPIVFGLHFLGYATMMVAGYLGGEMVYHHRLGVLEDDREAVRIRDRERTRAA